MDSLSIGINWGTKNTDPGLAYLNSNPPQLWLSADRYLSITGARALNGVNQHFKLASAVAAGSTKNITLEGWAKCNVNTKTEYVASFGGYTTYFGGFSIYKSTAVWAAKVSSSNADDGSTSYAITLLGPSISLNKWMHFCLTLDRSIGKWSFYVNSSLYGSAESTKYMTGNILCSTIFNCFGTYQAYSTANGFAGSMSRWRIALDYCYTQADIDESFNNGNGKFFAELSPALQARITHAWNMNEAGGQIIDCVSSNHGSVFGISTDIGSTYGPAESQVSDNSGNDYHGTLVGFTNGELLNNWIPSTFNNSGYALQFTTSDQYVDCGLSTSLAPQLQDFSIFLRFKISTTDSQYRVVFSQGWTSTDSLLIGVTGGYLIARLYFDTKLYGVSSTALLGSSIFDNQYHSVGMCVDRDGLFKVYLDNVVIYNDSTFNVKSTELVTFSNSSNSLYIGRAVGLSTVFDTFNGGSIDEIVYYNNYALAASDITALHNGNTPAITPTAHWTFNDGPQVTAVSNGEPIAGWQNRVGNREQFNQVTLANRPTYVAASSLIKNLPALSFDGVNDYLKYSTQLFTNTQGVLFAVLRPTLLPPVSAYTFLSQASTNTTNSRAHCYFSSANQIRIDVRKNSTSAAFSPSTEFVVTTNYQVFIIKSDGSTYLFKRNNVLTPTTGINAGLWFGDVNSSDVMNCNIGAIDTTLLFYPFKGEIAELIVYDSTVIPTDAQVADIEKYLMRKYGISS